MQAHSRIPQSAQTGIHSQLPALLERHLNTAFRKPYADYNRAACAASLGRRVTDITGVSPNGYLLRIRICAAQRMLRETSKSVTEIAFSCGFNDSNYFTNRFHRETGMAPLAYRKDVERSKPD